VCAGAAHAPGRGPWGHVPHDFALTGVSYLLALSARPPVCDGCCSVLRPLWPVDRQGPARFAVPLLRAYASLKLWSLLMPDLVTQYTRHRTHGAPTNSASLTSTLRQKGKRGTGTWQYAQGCAQTQRLAHWRPDIWQGLEQGTQATPHHMLRVPNRRRGVTDGSPAFKAAQHRNTAWPAARLGFLKAEKNGRGCTLLSIRHCGSDCMQGACRGMPWATQAWAGGRAPPPSRRVCLHARSRTQRQEAAPAHSRPGTNATSSPLVRSRPSPQAAFPLLHARAADVGGAPRPARRRTRPAAARHARAAAEPHARAARRRASSAPTSAKLGRAAGSGARQRRPRAA